MNQTTSSELTEIVKVAVAGANEGLHVRLDKIESRIAGIEDSLRRITEVSGVMDPTDSDGAYHATE